MNSEILLIFAVAFASLNISIIVFTVLTYRIVIAVQKKQREISEVHTMALSKIINILDSHTATLEDTSAESGEIKKGVATLLTNASAQTQALTKLVS